MDQETNTAFEGTLDGAAAGVDATGLLDVTSVEGGTQSVPVTIPTGRRGPATTHSRTQTLAIPDDDAGGVVSTLFVPINDGSRTSTFASTASTTALWATSRSSS